MTAQIRRINNQKKVPENKPTKWICASNFFFGLIFLCGFFGLGYILQVNKVAVMGYDIKNKEEELKKTQEENDNLKIDLASRQSIYLLEERKNDLGMVAPEKVDFLEIKVTDKLVLAE